MDKEKPSLANNHRTINDTLLNQLSILKHELCIFVVVVMLSTANDTTSVIIAVVLCVCGCLERKILKINFFIRNFLIVTFGAQAYRSMNVILNLLSSLFSGFTAYCKRLCPEH